jgi:hypothetical protein
MAIGDYCDAIIDISNAYGGCDISNALCWDRFSNALCCDISNAYGGYDTTTEYRNSWRNHGLNGGFDYWPVTNAAIF